MRKYFTGKTKTRPAWGGRGDAKKRQAANRKLRDAAETKAMRAFNRKNKETKQ
jgi:hypothetical protein